MRNYCFSENTVITSVCGGGGSVVMKREKNKKRERTSKVRV